jgi:hypothetical protein
METRKRDDKQHCGVFEKEYGSGIWWISNLPTARRRARRLAGSRMP